VYEKGHIRVDRGVMLDKGNQRYDIAHPDFGAKLDGVTDDGLAWQDAVTAIQAAGSGELFIPDGESMVYKDGTTYTNLCTFEDLHNLTINARGTIKIDPDREFTTSYGTIFHVTACHNTRINVKRITGPSTLDETGVVKGLVGVQAFEGCNGMVVPEWNSEGGTIAGFLFNNQATPEVAANKCKNITFGTVKVSNSWYGIVGTYSGDNLKCTLLDCDNVFRPWFAYGCRGWDMTYESKDQQGSNILQTISGYATEDMYFRGTNKDSTDTADHPHIEVIFANQTAGTLRDITFVLDLNFAETNSGGPAVSVMKLTNLGAFDTTDRGHSLLGVKFRGRITGNPSETTGGVIGTHPECSFGAGDTCDNFDIDMDLVGSRYVDWQCGWMAGKDIRCSVRSDAVVRFTTSRTDTKTGPARIDWRGSSFPNLFAFVGADEAYPVAHHVVAAADAAVTLTAGQCDGRLISNQFASGTRTYALPAAVSGLRVRALSVNAELMRFNPNGSELFRGQAAGDYLQLGAAGSVSEFVCEEVGVWDVLYEKGTIAYAA
jgi:hypothetical protein